MNNAQAVFETLDRFTKIQDLLGKQEDIFLDFKEREHGWNSQDKMSDNEKRLFSRAASGFAHQEGGVLVWGIEAKKDSSGVDQAYALKPFGKVKQFKQALEDHTKYATEPIVDGVLHRVVFVNDDEAGDQGFVVSYFPKSNRVHRALRTTTADFYKRHGDSFTPLSTDDVRALFFRTLAPDVEFAVEKKDGRPTPNSTTAYERTLSLRNVGSGVAKFVSLYVGFTDVAGIHNVHWYDGEGGQNFPIGKLVAARSYEKRGQLFILNGDILIYPDQSLALCGFVCEMESQVPLPGVKLKVFAENMIPRESEI